VPLRTPSKAKERPKRKGEEKLVGRGDARNAQDHFPITEQPVQLSRVSSQSKGWLVVPLV
jgi:hypothetical protein